MGRETTLFFLKKGCSLSTHNPRPNFQTTQKIKQIKISKSTKNQTGVTKKKIAKNRGAFQIPNRCPKRPPVFCYFFLFRSMLKIIACAMVLCIWLKNKFLALGFELEFSIENWILVSPKMPIGAKKPKFAYPPMPNLPIRPCTFPHLPMPISSVPPNGSHSPWPWAVVHAPFSWSSL